MGVVANKKELVVTSLNYSGILLSPFEFYSEDFWKQEEQLSQCFKTLLTESQEKFDPKVFKWGLGKIDKDMQKQRYSPLYQANAGIEADKLIDAGTFRKVWDQWFNKNAGVLKTPATETERNECREFDLMCYHSLLFHLYGTKTSEKAKQLDPKKYINFMKKFFKKSFLNQKEKIEKTMIAMKLQEVDVFLVQQSSAELTDLIDKKVFKVIHSKKGQSCIILRRQRFQIYHETQKILSQWPEDLRKTIDWNEDTAFCFVDNLIIFSFHISSKKEKNPGQIKTMLQNLNQIRLMYPMCEIIAGGDANSFISQESLAGKNNWNSYPQSEKGNTTMKKRTWLQPQVNKAEQLAATCRDHLLTTVKQINPRVVTIRGTPSNKVQYIPNEEHPYDHFVVTANIVIYR